MEQKNSPVTVPVAIVVAGILIASAIFFRGSVGPQDTIAKKAVVQAPLSLGALTLRPVDEARDHIRGNPEADIVFVEFSDTECPFCKRFHFTMQQIIDEYGKTGKVAWVYRQYPIVQLHSKAPKEAEALECAAELGGNGKFWDYADRVFTLTNSNDSLDLTVLPRIASEIGIDETTFAECLSSGRHQARVQSDIEDGTAAGVNGTPHSILVLRKPITAEDRNTILASMEQFSDGQGNLPIGFSLDGLRLSMNGALPYEIVKATVKTLLE